MAKKTTNNQAATKSDIDALRKSTKLDLKSETGILKIEFHEAFEQYDEKNRGYRDEILTGLDKVMKELETIREDNIVGTHQIRELRVDVDSHEKRISSLEQATS